MTEPDPVRRALAVAELIQRLIEGHTELLVVEPAEDDGPLFARLVLQAHGRPVYVRLEEGLPR